jgi:hypothetical protein
MKRGTSILILVANTPNAMCQNEFQLSVNNLRGEYVVDLPLATRFFGSDGGSDFGGSSDGRESSVGVGGSVSVWPNSKRGAI